MTPEVVANHQTPIDILFIVDDSPAAAAHQPLWSEAIPRLVEHVLQPPCLDEHTSQEVLRLDPRTSCPPGSYRSYRPHVEVHVGIITTSLGGPAGQFCSPGAEDFHPYQQGRGHLLGTTRPGVPSNGAGYLTWLPGDSVDAFVQQVRAQVEAIGHQGCPFPAVLEAGYRFLLEPEPAQGFEIDAEGRARGVGIDTELLRQRREFRQRGSLLLPIFVTAQDDCSLMMGSPELARGEIGWQFGSIYAPEDCFGSAATESLFPAERYLALSGGVLEEWSEPAFVVGIPAANLIEDEVEAGRRVEYWSVPSLSSHPQQRQPLLDYVANQREFSCGQSFPWTEESKDLRSRSPRRLTALADQLGAALSSVCPMVLAPSDPDFGFNPTIETDSLFSTDQLSEVCVHEIEVRDREPQIVVVELSLRGCAGPGRRPLDLANESDRRLRRWACGQASLEECTGFEACEVLPGPGADRVDEPCPTEVSPEDSGYCVEPAAPGCRHHSHQMRFSAPYPHRIPHDGYLVVGYVRALSDDGSLPTLPDPGGSLASPDPVSPAPSESRAGRQGRGLGGAGTAVR